MLGLSLYIFKPFSAPLMSEVLPWRENMRRIAFAVTVRGMDAGNSTQDHQLVPGRRPEQSSLNIVNKVGSNLETLDSEDLDLKDPYRRRQVDSWR